LACDHVPTLDHAAISSGGSSYRGRTALSGVLARRGDEHEEQYLAALRSEGLDIVEIRVDGSSLDALRAAEAATLSAMDSGADVVYQGTFLADDNEIVWRGHADFLCRVSDEERSNGYEIEDTKLARRVGPGAVMQLCNYAEHLERLQGFSPHHVHVVLGNGDRVSLRLSEFDAYYRVAKAKLVARLSNGTDGATYPLPVQHCAVCRWRSTCRDRWVRDDHLTLVAGMTKSQAARLATAGVDTVSALASSAPDLRVRRVSETSLRRLQHQARLQVEARDRPGAPPPFELLEPQGAGLGLELLPEPSPGDLFFDIESDPYAAEGGLEYLLGVGWLSEPGEFSFEARWAHSPAEEKLAFEALIDFIVERRREFPDMHVYHYAPYEPSALGRLTGRHGTRESEVDQLLRDRVLVDLYRVVRQSMIVGVESYSIKKLEPLYMDGRDADIIDAGSSIMEYERWLDEPDQSILDAIEEYNRDDCRSTWLLRDWLEGRRIDAALEFGGELERPRTPVEEDDAPIADDETDVVVGQLLAVAGEEPYDDPGSAATWLLAQLLRWHRREQKPEWWAYFHRIGCDVDELFDDAEAIAGLTYEGVVDTVKSSLVHRYRFDPEQEHKIGVDKAALDPASEHAALHHGASIPGPGTVVAVDSTAGTIDLKRGKNSAAPHPECLIPPTPLPDAGQRGALLELGRSVLEYGIDGPGPGRAARELLLRRAPRLRGGHEGKLTRGAPQIADLTSIAMRLDESCVAVQGPPGTGKTYTAARSIVQLIRAGKRIGVTANSHAVVTNLLDEVMVAAAEAKVSVRAMQKSDRGSERDDVTVTGSNSDIESAIDARAVDIVGGTPWLFVRDNLVGAFDYLVVDEAGQLSLANVIAISRSAANLILVGDPQQLAQPSKGSHPPGAEASALSHLLDGAETIPPERGLFLEASWRMHPDVCRFVSERSYDGRLGSIADCARQHVHGSDLLSGSGLRWVPVDHSDNRNRSVEEAQTVASLVDQLVGRTWTDREGQELPLTLDDLLIVAPYNAQVHALLEALPEGAQVGTVDKFQGREGAVAILSLAASDAEAIPRGLEFLFDRNRLNVAVSRAKAMSIIVASPKLLTARCGSVEQLRLVNGLCRYTEMTERVAPSSPVGSQT
jgi:uncharacterized protein